MPLNWGTDCGPQFIGSEEEIKVAISFPPPYLSETSSLRYVRSVLRICAPSSWGWVTFAASSL